MVLVVNCRLKPTVIIYNLLINLCNPNDPRKFRKTLICDVVWALLFKGAKHTTSPSIPRASPNSAAYLAGDSLELLVTNEVGSRHVFVIGLHKEAPHH